MFKEKEEKETMILHIDADAFFVSCEIARLPELRGKPVIVGGERGIACAMSYEAKALGIVRAMPVFEIKKRFPQTVILPAHFDLYYAYQNNLVSFLRTRFSSVEIYSIDECFLEVSKEELAFNEKALENLRKEIGSTLGISYSLGLARTKTLAKVASKKNKPNGSYMMSEKTELENIQDLSVSSIWGIGRRTGNKLNKLGIIKVDDLLKVPNSLLEKEFGIQLLRIRDELRGIKRIELEIQHIDQKSLQVTRSFRKTNEISYALSELSLNIEKLVRQLREKKLVTNKISVWVKEIAHGTESYHERVKELPQYTDSGESMLQELHFFFEELRRRGLREYKGTGVYAHTLIPKAQVPKTLFEDDISSSVDILSMLSISGEAAHESLLRASSLLAYNKRKDSASKENSESFYLANLPYPYLGIAS